MAMSVMSNVCSWDLGNMDVFRHLLTKFDKNGISVSTNSTKKNVGVGSRQHVSLEEDKMIVELNSGGLTISSANSRLNIFLSILQGACLANTCFISSCQLLIMSSLVLLNDLQRFN
ncbi:hypothetical protein HELRODRAFT_163928 [Helobdella robusta]|uniref:Uncharacterized protein n=1 Tax=Helobdella robusta TaxID=6412 RepID=T1EUM6_HELRO|nr:hypothetical protein HELRODRAFT_163928 [Helobdella robusta]ESN94149.1 hypothetical protein HELRODRAFT_163928 [Helobdella robusta]